MDFSVLVSIVPEIIKAAPNLGKNFHRWYSYTLPSRRILEGIIDEGKLVRIFVKDLIVPDNTNNSPKLFSVEGAQLLAHPNITEVWPKVEAEGIIKLMTLLNQLGKRKKVEIVEMSKGHDLWDSNLIVLGAQAGKCRNFYDLMENVGYYMDEQNIYDHDANQIILREGGFGYGIILKSKNNQLPGNQSGIGILLGGFGVLGTAAAISYFCNNINLLGKEFKNNYFSLVIRAKITAGSQSVERLRNYDKVYSRN